MKSRVTTSCCPFTASSKVSAPKVKRWWRRPGEGSDKGHSGRNCGGNGDESDKYSSVAGWEVLDFEGFEGEFTFVGKVKYGYTASEKFAVSFNVGWNIDWLWKGDSDCSGYEAERKRQ